MKSLTIVVALSSDRQGHDGAARAVEASANGAMMMESFMLAIYG